MESLHVNGGFPQKSLHLCHLCHFVSLVGNMNSLFCRHLHNITIEIVRVNEIFHKRFHHIFDSANQDLKKKIKRCNAAYAPCCNGDGCLVNWFLLLKKYEYKGYNSYLDYRVHYFEKYKPSLKV